MTYDDQYSETEVDTDAKYLYKPIVPLLKSVRFAEQIEILFVERIDDYTEEELDAVWYNVNDFNAIKHEIQKIVKLMEVGVTVPPNKESTRGLEHRTRKGALLKFHNKRTAYCAVLDEQDDQWKNGIFDSNAIAKVYLKHSATCQAAAARIGQKDAVAAQRIQRFFPINKYHDQRNLRKRLNQ